jgi:hypothetical protein
MTSSCDSIKIEKAQKSCFEIHDTTFSLSCCEGKGPAADSKQRQKEIYHGTRKIF